MDRKAGYKECQRCGLRNKPSALQCDFCGLRFIAGEEWDDNIQALEKMGGNEEKVLVDEDVSKRIEATIVKRDKINATVKTKEPENEFDYFRKDPEPVQNEPAPTVLPSVEVDSAPAIEPIPEPVVAPVIQAAEKVVLTPPVETPAVTDPERIIISETPEPVKVEVQPEAVEDKEPEGRGARQTREVKAPAKTSNHRTAYTVVLTLGALGYLVAITLGTDAIGRIGSWALVAAATVMMVVGAGGLFKGRTMAETTSVDGTNETKPHKDVLICPNCHELVSVTDRSCPDCGAEFGASE